MPPEDYFKLKKQAALATLISAALPASVMGAAGRVDFAVGDVHVVTAGGGQRALSKGSAINGGETIRTRNGRAHIRFTDGAYVSLKPNSEFRVDEYAYEPKDESTRRGFFSLVRGGLRTITGLIGRSNRANYRMRTPVATIGIRGTHYAVDVQPDPTTENSGSAQVRNFEDSHSLTTAASPEIGLPPGWTAGYNFENGVATSYVFTPPANLAGPPLFVQPKTFPVPPALLNRQNELLTGTGSGDPAALFQLDVLLETFIQRAIEDEMVVCCYG